MQINGQYECKQCLLNSSDTDHIYFDDKGICNYCNYYTLKVKELGTGAEKQKYLSDKIQQIKKLGEGKKYDMLCSVLCHDLKHAALEHLAIYLGDNIRV